MNQVLSRAILLVGYALVFAADTCRADVVYYENISGIYEVTQGGTPTLLAAANGTVINNPVGIATDGSGNLLVTSLGVGNIAKVTPGGIVSIYASEHTLQGIY